MMDYLETKTPDQLENINWNLAHIKKILLLLLIPIYVVVIKYIFFS